MKIKRERLSNTLTEVETLLNDYYYRTGADKDQPPLNVDWNAFLELENKSNLVLITARIEDKMIGYVLYILYAHIKYSGTMWALCDTLAVNPDYRGKGIGAALVKDAEKLCRNIGVDYLIHGYRTDYNVTPLFEKLGFTCTERIYMKVL